MFTSPGGPKSVNSITAKSADETCGVWIDARGYANVTAYCLSTGTTSSGVVSFEEASPTADGSGPIQLAEGKYSVVTTATASDFTGDAEKAYHFPPNASYGFVRPRISTAVGGGGTVTVRMVLS